MKCAFLKVKLLLACFLISAAAMAQSKTISGRVVDEGSEPLLGAYVIIKGTSNGAQTDINGEYNLEAAEGNVLVFSYIGFEDQEVTVGQSAVINVILTTAINKMEEVVVVGYGTTKRSKLTSSVAKLDAKILETGIRSNPAQALAGTIPGLRVSTGSGRPGSLPAISLRGGTNFDGSGSPLIIMDGQVRSSLSDINPEDISSIEVLKDASATAIYGARASNGVILITSKRGTSGSASVNLKINRGISFLNVPYNFLSAEDYISWTRLGVVQAIINGTTANNGLSAAGPRGTGNLYKDAAGNILDGNYDNRAQWSVMRLNDINKELLGQPGWKTMKDAVPTNAAGNYDPNGTYADLIYKDFNYGEYGLNDQADIQEYNVGINGGNERGGYFANLGIYDEGGLSLKTFYRRINFSLNGDYKINSWLKSESSLQYNNATWRDQTLQNGETNYWGRMLSAPPTMRGTNANGDLILGRDANDGNPIINIDKFIRKNQNDKFTLGQTFRIDLFKGLYFRAGGILMYDEGFDESFNKDFRSGTLSYTNPDAGWNRTRASSASFDRTIRQTYNGVFNYANTFDKNHNVNAQAGFEFFDAYSKGVSAAGSLAPTDDFADLGLTLNNATTQTRTTNSFHNRERISSQFGRINYDWSSKYFATFTIRRDGYSRLLGDNQFGTFPAASVGWIVSKEGFMGSTEDWLSYLRLRGSWGKNGNIGGIGIYELQGSYGAQSAYNGTLGFLLSGIANPGLRWEKTNTVEVGADVSLFDYRLTGTLAYYNRITDDKIANLLLPTSTGVSSIRTNNGSMRNRGLELEASYKLIQKKDFTWDISANGAWNKNTVLKLPFNGNDRNRQGGQQIYDPATGGLIWVGGLQEGQEWGEIFGFVADGIIRNESDLASYNKIDLAAGQVWQNGAAGKRVASQQLITEGNLNGTGANFIATQLGDVMWKDIDMNDTIDYRDMTSLGRQLPRWTGGFNTTVSWKGLSLFARFDFGLGHIQQDFMQLWSMASAQGTFNATELVKETWTPENPDAKYPRYVWADQLNTKNFDRPSSMFYVNSSYLAIRQVTMSYALPSEWLKRVKIAGLTLSVTGQNLGYVSNSLLNLPERTGSQNSAYTIPTQIVFGANLKFQ